MARYRGTTAQRGLGTAHRTDKERLLALHHDGDPCWRCGKPMFKWQALDRDHVVDRALGGAQGPAVLAHSSCNRSAGARLGNQLRPLGLPRPGVGHDVTCPVCGKVTGGRAPRRCEICGAHYHPNHGEQRTCGRTCGVVLQQRNKMAKGWVPKAQRPKPPRRLGPVASGERAPKNGWPVATIAYYTCRYCGKLGINRTTTYQPREVCTAAACQMLRLKANKLRVRYGLSAATADAEAVAGHVAASRSAWHICPGCGERTERFRWCDECLCTSVNAKGSRCGNPVSTDGKCDYHSEADGYRVAARQW